MKKKTRKLRLAAAPPPKKDPIITDLQAMCDWNAHEIGRAIARLDALENGDVKHTEWIKARADRAVEQVGHRFDGFMRDAIKTMAAVRDDKDQILDRLRACEERLDGRYQVRRIGYWLRCRWMGIAA